MQAKIMTTPRIYVRSDLNPDERRDQMQVLLNMLKRTSADDGQALLEPAEKDLSTKLVLIVDAK